MASLPQLNAGQAIVKKDGTMEPVFRDRMNAFTAQFPIIGVGPPETVVPGEYLQVYIDVTGTSGSIEYRKMAMIPGDKTIGWVAV